MKFICAKFYKKKRVSTNPVLVFVDKRAKLRIPQEVSPYKKDFKTKLD